MSTNQYLKFATIFVMEKQGNNFSFAKTNKQTNHTVRKFPNYVEPFRSLASQAKPRVCNSDINLFKFHPQLIK